MSWAQLQGSLGGGTGSLSMLLPGGMRQQRTAVLKTNNQLVKAAQLPRAERQAVEARLEQAAPGLPVLARLLAPALLKVSQSVDRSQAEGWCAVAMLATERYRLAHGKWPEKLADLVPRYLAAVPEDPFDGHPLRSRVVADGLVIYSVSLDGVDNHGTKLSMQLREKGTDIGLRLYDVPRRRQPARPLKPPGP
jgi:hypothetical protein